MYMRCVIHVQLFSPNIVETRNYLPHSVLAFSLILKIASWNSNRKTNFHFQEALSFRTFSASTDWPKGQLPTFAIGKMTSRSRSLQMPSIAAIPIFGRSFISDSDLAPSLSWIWAFPQQQWREFHFTFRVGSAAKFVSLLFNDRFDGTTQEGVDKGVTGVSSRNRRQRKVGSEAKKAGKSMLDRRTSDTTLRLSTNVLSMERRDKEIDVIFESMLGLTGSSEFRRTLLVKMKRLGTMQAVLEYFRLYKRSAAE